MVVCTALISPPVIASITRIGSGDDCPVIDMRLMTIDPATAPAVIASIVVRDPNRAITDPPAIAPTTPPRLKSVRPVLAAAALRPALASSDGSQLKPRYTASKQERKAAQSAMVST